MGICNYVPENIYADVKSMNERVLDGISALPDKLRKEIRLLAKQYEILSMEQEPPLAVDASGGMRLIKPGNYNIEYMNRQTREIYYWIIDGNEFL